MNEVKIDEFGNIDEAKIFFLSHCHSDHYQHLPRAMAVKVGQQPRTLYCSEISKTILLHKFAQTLFSGNIQSLELGITKYITTGTESMNVTALPANHCPGSCIFLFQTENFTQLHTGDFRFDKALLTLPQIRSVAGSLGSRPVDLLCLDTTFCDFRAFKTLPSKITSQIQIISLIRSVSKTKPVLIRCQPLGLEDLFIAIKKELGETVLLSESKYKQLIKLFPEELDGIITSDPKQSRIRICSKDFPQLSPHQSKEVLKIRASVQWSQHWKLAKECSEKPVFNCGVYHVLAATHSSFDELCEFVKFLQPRRIKALVPCHFESFQMLLSIGNSQQELSISSINAPKRLLSLSPKPSQQQQEEAIGKEFDEEDEPPKQRRHSTNDVDTKKSKQQNNQLYNDVLSLIDTELKSK